MCSPCTRTARPFATPKSHGFLSGRGNLFAPKVRLPDERTGTFMVFKTFDRMSFGLIMEATDVMHVGDDVKNP